MLGPWGGSEEGGEGGNVGVCLWVVVGNSSGRREILEDVMLFDAARFRHKLERAPKDGTEGSLGPR